LLNLNLINTDDQFNDTDAKKLLDNVNIQITAKGFYYYKHWVKKFQYIDLVLQDTPIFSEGYLGRLRTLFPLSNDKAKETFMTGSDYENVHRILADHEKNRPPVLTKFFRGFVD